MVLCVLDVDTKVVIVFDFAITFFPMRPSHYEGTIQSDGLGAYKKVVAQSDGKVRRLACLQHCKRDFVDMNGNPDADEILGLANGPYEAEHKHKIGCDGWTAEDNLKWRQEYAPPILEKLKTALLRVQAQTDKYPPKSQMRGAVNYFLNEWDGIEAIPTAGDYSWDNNQIEGINRYVSLSRKNPMFFGSHAGAERGCIFYSLACSCRLHKINFFEYLSDVLNRCAEMPNGAPPDAFYVSAFVSSASMMMESGSELYEAMKSSMKASPISNSSLRDRRFSRRVIVGWEARSISSEADRPAHIFRIPSRHSLSQSSASSKPAIIWYILWRSISVWLCTTMGFRRGSLMQDSMRSMMRFDDFSYSRTRGSPPKRGEFGCREICRHFLAGHGLKFKQCRKSLVICGI